MTRDRQAGPLIIELHPQFLVLRTKGSRTRFELSYAAAWDLARKLAARAERQGGK